MTGEWSPTAPSFTYHSDDGKLWANSFRPLHKTVYGEGEFGPGSTIGCGVVIRGVSKRTIFTRETVWHEVRITLVRNRGAGVIELVKLKNFI